MAFHHAASFSPGSRILVRSPHRTTTTTTTTTRLHAVTGTVTSSDVTTPWQYDEEPSSKSSSSSSSFENFDFLAHWYPVIWACDLLPNQPTKVTLFDTEYVVARVVTTNNDKKKNQPQDDAVIAMLDQCPHKAAALSEGRITASGYLQCAYHGWSFNGTTGACVEIPQLVQDTNDKTARSSSGAVISSSRSCGTAVPAMIQQGMVYLFPGGTWEKALLEPPPFSIPEMDQKGFKSSLQIVDMPVDWPILMENILDPDHGVFVHNMASFDWYSASKDFAQSIAEEYPNQGKGWQITSRVDAVEKVLAVDKARRGGNKKPVVSKKSDDTIPTATTLFAAPSFALTGRRDKKTGETTFLIAFYVCPVGTGRARLMTASIAKAPFMVPRWIMAILFNNFLDQDTYLLATQHTPLLKKEAEQVKLALKEQQQEEEGGGEEVIDGDFPPLLDKTFNNKVRRTVYNYRSPTERASARIGNFWDATLHRAPNRIKSLLAMERRGDLDVTPPRHEVLDRDKYHLQVCPGSQDVVQNCQNIRQAAILITTLTIALKLYATLAFLSAGSSGSSISWLIKYIHDIPTTVVGTTIALSALAGWVAEKIRREFYFKYDQKSHRKDLENIPKKVWLDA